MILGLGVIRHADAAYDSANRMATRQDLNIGKKLNKAKNASFCIDKKQPSMKWKRN
jgi:hypothetical protein